MGWRSRGLGADDHSFFCEAGVGVFQGFFVYGFKVGEVALVIESLAELRKKRKKIRISRDFFWYSRVHNGQRKFGRGEKGYKNLQVVQHLAIWHS